MTPTPGSPALDRLRRARLVETAIGIALVVISAIEILGIVRVVSANLNIGK